MMTTYKYYFSLKENFQGNQQFHVQSHLISLCVVSLERSSSTSMSSVLSLSASSPWDCQSVLIISSARPRIIICWCCIPCLIPRLLLGGCFNYFLLKYTTIAINFAEYGGQEQCKRWSDHSSKYVQLLRDWAELLAGTDTVFWALQLIHRMV